MVDVFPPIMDRVGQPFPRSLQDECREIIGPDPLSPESGGTFGNARNMTP